MWLGNEVGGLGFLCEGGKVVNEDSLYEFEFADFCSDRCDIKRTFLSCFMI